MSHCSPMFSVDFLELYWKDEIWRICRSLRTNSQLIRKEKKIIDSNIDFLQVSFEKYVPNHLLSLLSKFVTFFVVVIILNWFSKSSLQNEQSMRILKIEFSLLLTKYALCKRLICLKWILKNFSTTLHSQLNHYV